MSEELKRKIKQTQKALLKMMNKTKVNSNGCWIYTGYKNECGYGRFRVAGKKTLAHRFSYEMRVGNIPDGMLVLHTCDNPACIKPEHLYLGKDKDNAGDMVDRKRQWLQRAKEQGLRFDIRNGVTPDGYQAIK